MPELILALDQGTTGSTAAFFEAQTLRLVANAKVEFPQLYPEPGLVEHDPEEIWSSMLRAIGSASENLRGAKVSDVIAIGIANQRETVIPWNRRTNEVAGNAIVWQDRRTAPFCDSMKRERELREKILRETGLICDPYFSGSKIHWMLNNSSSVQALVRGGDLLIGTVDSFLISRLTQGKAAATDDTNASRTMLYSLKTGTYDDDLLNLFGVNRSFLPEIRPSIGIFGYTKGVPGLPDGIPISGCLGDQQAALFGHDAVNPGEGKITYGTGAFLLVNTGSSSEVSEEGLLTTVAFSDSTGRTYALEGSAFIAGAAIQYLRDNFHWFSKAPEADTLALKEPRDPHVLFIPAFAGLGAPYWNPQAKGVLFGLSRGTKKEQVIRAVLESIALQNVQILTLMEKTLGRRLQRLGVDGGAAKSDYLMQFQADTVRVDLRRLATTEITALGAAKAALLGIGRSRPSEGNQVERIFTPTSSESDARRMVDEWARAARYVDQFYREHQG